MNVIFNDLTYNFLEYVINNTSLYFYYTRIINILIIYSSITYVISN